MRLGEHVSIGKGLINALDHADDLGCETIQMFSGNPNAWRETFVPQEQARLFRVDDRRCSIQPVVLHTPYLLNLATTDDLIYARSRSSLTAALNRAAALDANYVVTHIGSHGGRGYDDGVRRIQAAITDVVAEAPGNSVLLLEGGSGSGHTIGSTFEELADILSGLGGEDARVGIALDTAHLWGSGYDISGERELDRVLQKFDSIVGLHRLKVMHCNDTEVELGSHRDRHWHIGKGNIGLDGFRALVNHPALTDVPGILETPMEHGMDRQNLQTLKSLRR